MQTTWQKIKGIKANRLYEIKDMHKKDWLQARKKGIGGSDISSVAGVNPFQTNVDVYLQKVENMSFEENEKMKWGKILEPSIALEYRNNNNNLIDVENVFAILQSPDHPFALANLDRLIIFPEKNKSLSSNSKYSGISGNGILEVKCSSWAQSWEEEIPDYHYCQIQWYLGVTGLQWAEFAVLLTGNDYQESGIIPFDPKVFNNLIKIADTFWNQHVLKKIPPLPQAKPAFKDAHSILYPKIKNEIAKLPDSLNPLIQRRNELSTYKKTIEGQISEINSNILHRLTNNKYGQTSQYKVTCVEREQRYFQERKFKEAHPGLFNSFSTLKNIRYPLFKQLK